MFRVMSLISMTIVTPFFAQAGYMPTEKAFPCIEQVACESRDEMDPVLTKVSVDYYDDLGTPYHWSAQLHTQENYAECDAAMKEKFPYAFFKRCEVTEGQTP